MTLLYEADPDPDDLDPTAPNPDILQVDTQVDPEPPVVYDGPQQAASQN